MPKLAVAGAQLQCTFGTAPAVLSVSRPSVSGTSAPAGNVDDHQAMVSIPPFGTCTSMANPQVAAATAAAQGTLTPQPCTPLVTAPWTPGASKAQVDRRPALGDHCRCACTWQGQITITNAGQHAVDVS